MKLQVERLGIGWQIGSPLDLANLLNDISLGMPRLRELHIRVFRTRNKAPLDEDQVRALARPSFPNLQEFVFCTHFTYEEEIDTNEVLFQPILQHMLQGTELMPTFFETFLTTYGFVQYWANRHLEGQIIGKNFFQGYPGWSDHLNPDEYTEDNQNNNYLAAKFFGLLLGLWLILSLCNFIMEL